MADTETQKHDLANKQEQEDMTQDETEELEGDTTLVEKLSAELENMRNNYDNGNDEEELLEGESVTRHSVFSEELGGIPESYGESVSTEISEENKMMYEDQDDAYAEEAKEEVEAEVEEEEVEEEEEEEKSEHEKKDTEEAEEEEEQEEDESLTSAISQIYSKLSPFFIKWSFGIKISSKLINLTKGNQFEVFYASSHFGILFDYRKNEMTFLPGHNAPISGIAADARGRWLVTADEGDDSVIIVWDHDRRVPSWSLFNIFSGKGVRCVQISQDARFLVAVSNDDRQKCKFFLWTYGREQADGEIELGSGNGTAVHVRFNHLETTQFAITMETRVAFAQWSAKKKTIEHFLSGPRKRKGKIGLFRETLFLDDNHTALTSTNSGHVVVWCDVIRDDSENKNSVGSIEKKYLKTIRIHKSGITSMQLSDQTIVSSSEEGVISFHDQTLSLLYWVPRYLFESVVCVSCNLQQQRAGQMDPFSVEFDEDLSPNQSMYQDIEDLVEDDDMDDDETVHTETDEESSTPSKVLFTEDAKKQENMIVPSDCTIDMKPFHIRDFVFLMWNGRFGYVSHQRTKVRYFLYKYEAPILSMDCNPNVPHLATGNSLGRIDLYDHKNKKLLISTAVANTGVTSLKYSTKGRYLLAGLQNGTVLILDPLILTTKITLQVGKSEVCKFSFTSNEKIFAFYDKENTVYLHKLSKVEKMKGKKWVFMGGYRSHYKTIRDILINEDPEKGKVPRLFTIGEDRMLVEYDLAGMQPGMLKISSIDRIEQTAVPLCFSMQPKFGKETYFIVANNEYKFKSIQRDTRICEKTTIGPTADTPVTFLEAIPIVDDATKTAKMIYTTERHIGLRLLPTTGNPFEGMGMVAHPTKITSVAISHDYQYIFTTNMNDSSILMWKTNPKSVDIAHQLGGTGLDPFMSLIEGGPNGFLFKEIQDFFYYSQIIHQGEHANIDRSVTKNLAMCEVPDLVRALGYYPTEYEIANIMFEMKHLRYEETGELSTEVSFDECVKIYLNHRPVNGVSIESINKALLTIADLSDPECIIVEKEELYKSLEQRAEAMSHAEVVGYLCILLLPKDENDPIPGTMTLQEFADDVLGIDLSITEKQVREITHPFENKNN